MHAYECEPSPLRNGLCPQEQTRSKDQDSGRSRQDSNGRETMATVDEASMVSMLLEEPTFGPVSGAGSQDRGEVASARSGLEQHHSPISASDSNPVISSRNANSPKNENASSAENIQADSKNGNAPGNNIDHPPPCSNCRSPYQVRSQRYFSSQNVIRGQSRPSVKMVIAQ